LIYAKYTRGNIILSGWGHASGVKMPYIPPGATAGLPLKYTIFMRRLGGGFCYQRISILCKSIKLLQKIIRKITEVF